MSNWVQQKVDAARKPCQFVLLPPFRGYPAFVASGRRRDTGAAPSTLRGKHAARARPYPVCCGLSEESPLRIYASIRAAKVLDSPGAVGLRKQPAIPKSCAANCSQSELDSTRTKTGIRLRLGSHRMHATNSSPLTRGRLASTRIAKGAAVLINS